MDSLEGEGNQGRWVAGTFVSLCYGHPLLTPCLVSRPCWGPREGGTGTMEEPGGGGIWAPAWEGRGRSLVSDRG